MMLAHIDSGNQDDMSILDSATGLPLGTGVQDGTWILIPNGSTNLDGSTCNNTNGCSTCPRCEGSANPCVYNGWGGSPNSPASVGGIGAFDYTQDYSPCYNYDSFTGLVDTGWDGSVNFAYNSGFGRLDEKGWSHRAYDNTLNNPQTDLINLLNNEVIPGGAANWVPFDCFSAETDYNLDIAYPYSSYDGCTAGTESCVFNWYCDGLGTPCYESFGSLSDPGMYATEIACHSSL